MTPGAVIRFWTRVTQRLRVHHDLCPLSLPVAHKTAASIPIPHEATKWKLKFNAKVEIKPDDLKK
jgi:hypothetical protein